MKRADGDDHGATALDPDAVERAQPPVRQSGSLGGGRRSSRNIARRSSQAATDPLAGSTRPLQARGKRGRVVGEMDRSPTQPFGMPEPLPPSPVGRESSSGWFKPSLRTESIPDLSALTGDTGQHTIDRTFHGGGEPEAGEHPQGRRPLIDLHARPWLFPALLAATCLAVGMVLGALLFGNRLPQAQSEKEQVIIRCSDPPSGSSRR